MLRFLFTMAASGDLTDIALVLWLTGFFQRSILHILIHLLQLVFDVFTLRIGGEHLLIFLAFFGEPLDFLILS